MSVLNIFDIVHKMLSYQTWNSIFSSYVFVLSTAKATFDAISKTYSYLTPDLWKETVFTKSPYQVSTHIKSAARMLKM